MASNEYGGQAVVEGVMFGGKAYQVTAIRRINGEIEFLTIPRPLNPFVTRLKKIPLLRGVVAIIEASAAGSEHLQFSTNRFGILPEEDAEMEAARKTSKLTLLFGVAIVGILSFLFGKFLFTLLPVFAAHLLSSPFPGQFQQNLLEGLFKFILLIGYLLAISQTPLIKRVFQYHGAEHKLINTYENQQPLTVENVQKHSRLHFRCGSSFILFTIFVGVFVYVWFPTDPLWLRVMIRLLLLPLVIGLSFELLRLTNQFRHTPVLRLLGMPGLCLQRLTTKEPTPSQIEVAIASFNELLRVESERNASGQDHQS